MTRIYQLLLIVENRHYGPSISFTKHKQIIIINNIGYIVHSTENDNSKMKIKLPQHCLKTKLIHNLHSLKRRLLHFPFRLTVNRMLIEINQLDTNIL